MVHRAGAMRNFVWDHLHGFEIETRPEDVHLLFYDATDLSKDFERILESQLALVESEFNWKVVKPSLRPHWLKSYAGTQVEPFQSLAEGIASWPEIATCVGITLTASEKIKFAACHVVADLFEIVIRWNPMRVSRAVYVQSILGSLARSQSLGMLRMLSNRSIESTCRGKPSHVTHLEPRASAPGRERPISGWRLSARCRWWLTAAFGTAVVNAGVQSDPRAFLCVHLNEWVGRTYFQAASPLFVG